MNNLYNISNNFIQYSDVKSRLVVSGEKKRNPKVSILMPIYNHYEFLEQAIMSAINQDTEEDYEIVIVDNNHPDIQRNNKDIVKRINSNKVFYYVNEKNIGPCGNWNRCVELATAEYITFCHDDDMLTPNAISQLLSYIDKKAPYRSVVGSNVRINSKSVVISKKTHTLANHFAYYYGSDLLAVGNPTNGCGALYHKASTIKLGGFNPNFYPCFDYAFNALYSKHYGLLKIPAATFLYRVSEKSDSSQCYTEIPQISNVIVNNVLGTISCFKWICEKAAQTSIRMGEAQSKQIWEHKCTKPSFMDRVFLSLYVRSCTIVSIMKRLIK